jgi:spermidine synthase
MKSAPDRRLARLLAFAVLALAACAVEPALIHQRATPFGSILVHEGRDGLRTLRFSRDGARQSVVRPGDPDHIELPYARMALAGLALADEPRRMLVVGLGGGTLPGILRRTHPEATIEIAEISPDVVEVAREYFGFREDARMKVHLGDGRKFIEGVRGPAYDAIFLDAYGDRSVPRPLTTREFLEATRRAALPGGVVIANLWNRQNNLLYDDMVATWRDVFPELAFLNVAGDVNVILLALPRAEPIRRGELSLRAAAVSARKRLRFDLGPLVDQGFFEERAAGRVLRD